MGGDILAESLAHEREVDFADDADIFGAMDRLAGFKMSCTSKAGYKLREQAIGSTYAPCSPPGGPGARTRLKPVKVYCHDWLHCSVPNGVFNTVTYLFLKSVSAITCDTWVGVHKHV